MNGSEEIQRLESDLEHEKEDLHEDVINLNKRAPIAVLRN